MTKTSRALWASLSLFSNRVLRASSAKFSKRFGLVSKKDSLKPKLPAVPCWLLYHEHLFTLFRGIADNISSHWLMSLTYVSILQFEISHWSSIAVSQVVGSWRGAHLIVPDMDTQCAHTGSVCPLDFSCSILGQSFVCDGIWGRGQMNGMHLGGFWTILMGW